MSNFRTTAGAGVAIALLSMSVACGGPREPRTCQVRADCGPESYCAAGTCVGGKLPIAAITVIGREEGLLSHHFLQFDGSASIDPNPDHAVVAYEWRVRPTSAGGC